MSTKETINLTIDEKAVSYAKIYASMLSDEFQRKRAYASITALYAFINLAEKAQLNLQKSMTLFRNPLINEQYEISDLYINNWHLDVRVVTGGNSVLIPKIHYDSNITADFYIVVKVDSSLKNAELLGIVDTSNTAVEPFDYHYLSVPFSALIPYEEFLEIVKNEKEVDLREKSHDLFRESYLGLIDNEVDLQTKNKILAHLFECPECRTEFCCFTGFEMVCCNTAKYPELLNDETLSIIGAQKVDDEKYKNKEETIYFDDNQNETEAAEEKTEADATPVETAADNINITDETTDETTRLDEAALENALHEDETVSDILDELFSADEGFIEPVSQEEEKPLDTDIQNEQIQLNEDELHEENQIEKSDEEKIENYDEIDILDEEEKPNDNTEANIEAEISELPLIEESEIQVIYEDESGISSNSDLQIIEHEEEEQLDDNYTSDIVLIEKEPDNNLQGENEIKEEKSVNPNNAQKVIIDYDEYGEPIYSYITDTEQLDIINDDTDYITEDTTSAAGENTVSDETPAVHPYEEENTDNIEALETPIINIESDETDEAAAEEDIESSNNDDVQEEQTSDETEYEENQDETSDVEADSYDEIDAPDDDEEQSSDEIEYKENQDETSGEEAENSDKIDTLDDEEQSSGEIEYKENQDETSDVETDSNDEIDAPDDDEEQSSDEVEEEYESDEETEEADESEGGEYDDYDIDELLPEENVKKFTPKTALILISTLLVLILAAGAGAFFFMKNQKHEQTVAADNQNDNIIEIPSQQQTNDMFEQPAENSETIPVTVIENNTQVENFFAEPPAQEVQEANTTQDNNSTPNEPVTSELAESDLIQPAQNTTQDVNNAIVNAFTQNNSGVFIRDLNWFCTSELFSDNNFKKYLQNLDNILKQNLKNNILNTQEIPSNDHAAVKFAVDNNGNLRKVIISESSGSEAIDKIVLQSINESFEGEKRQILNDSPLKSDMYYLKAVIKF